MELLSFVLPMEIVRKVRVYHSRPVADLIRSDEWFKDRKYKSERVHGCPYDRGGAVAYYYREPNPHYWTNGNGRNGYAIYDLTAEEIEAYHLGYNNQHNRR